MSQKSMISHISIVEIFGTFINMARMVVRFVVSIMLMQTGTKIYNTLEEAR